MQISLTEEKLVGTYQAARWVASIRLACTVMKLLVFLNVLEVWLCMDL